MVRIFPARYSTGHKTLSYAYMFIISSPISPIISPQPFFTVIFSLNKTEESNVTDIIPLPLNNGNIITDGMLEARYVITRLMTQRETAEPNPHITYFMEILQCKNPFFENIVNNKNAQVNE